MAHAIVSVRSVTKHYGTTPVLRGVNLEVLPGEFVSLMGASGSGKTTLLNVIGTLDAADSGEVRVADTDLHRLPDGPRSDFRLRNLGFVFQFFNLLPNLSVRENIQLPLLFLRESEQRAAARAQEVAEQVGLQGKLERPIHQLSGGEMQRVGLARALAHRPKLLLADEPTGNLDSRTGVQILELLTQIAKQQALAILMATHDPKAAEYSDRVVHMVDGEVVQQGGG
jgi:putative ABC transport system ATP-binding protein